jgi:formylglycine-generating enzyme required for sulfatase activity
LHEVTINKPFSISIFPITFEDYDKYTLTTGKQPIDDFGWGRGTRPVINVNIDDANSYAEWLSRQTGHYYRIPSEAEWEYAARAGTQTNYPWGDEIGVDNASCNGCGTAPQKITQPVGTFKPNNWGLYDTQGNIWEMTADCWNYDYVSAPTDGSTWRGGDCTRLVLRGGSWGDHPRDLRSSTRLRSYAKTRTIIIGFRIVREN